MRSAQMKKDPTGGKSSNPSKGDGVKRSLSFGSLQGSVSIHDFHLLKVLGRGSFGKCSSSAPCEADRARSTR